MSDFLEYRVDKFTFRVATDRHYHADGVWAKEEGGRIRVGLSDFAQQHSGDIAFAEVVEVGTELAFGDEVADVETIKVDMSLPSPAAGTVVEVNPELEMAPEIINEDPYGAGWLALITPADWPADQARLLAAAAYLEVMKRIVAEENANL